MARSLSLIEAKMRERQMFIQAMHQPIMSAEEEEERLLQQAIEESKQQAQQDAVKIRKESFVKNFFDGEEQNSEGLT